MAPNGNPYKVTKNVKKRQQPLLLKFAEKRTRFAELTKDLELMSTSFAEGAFNGTRSKSRSVADSPSNSPAPHDGNVPLSKSSKRSDRLQKAVTAPGSKPQGILKRKGASSTKKNVKIKAEPDVHTFARSNSVDPSERDSATSSSVDTSTTAPQPSKMAEQNRPKLKLKLSTQKLKNDTPNIPQTPSAASTSLPTPSLKLKLKTQKNPTGGAHPAATPASEKPKKTKKSAPSSSAKKRKQREDDGAESSADELGQRPQKIKKIRFLQKSADALSPTVVTPTIKLKTKGKVPKRPMGVGYDSELSDRENDPTVSEAFMFRMPPGPDCDYLQHAVDNNLIGISPREGGADIRMQFWDRHGRRATITIRGRRYAAAMVDLPCIIEGMKSWDKKGWIKSADISQMLLVLGRVETDEQSQTFPLPPEIDPDTFQYAHGVTPPMQWVRKRRFARTKRTSVSAIEAVERKVNQLLADDEAAESVKWEVLDYDTYTRQEYEREHSVQHYDEETEGYYDEEDAEGEEEDDYFGRNETDGDGFDQTAEDVDMDEDAVARELEAHLMASEDEEEDETNALESTGPATHPQIPTPHADGDSFALTSTSASPAAGTTAAETPASHPGESSGVEESSDVDDDQDASEASDDEAAAALREQREKIEELEESIKAEEEKFKSMQNPILRKKIQTQIQKLRADLEMARRGAGEDEGED